MCGIILVSASSKKRLNSSQIWVVLSSLYSKHGDTLLSQFNVPLRTIFKCFDFATFFSNMLQSFWRAILFAGLAQNWLIWTGIFDANYMFITSRGSQLTWLLLSPSSIESLQITKTMSRWLNSQEFCTINHADLIISSNTVIFCRYCLWIMDMKSTTITVRLLHPFENLKSPGSVLSSNFLTKVALIGLNV